MATEIATKAKVVFYENSTYSDDVDTYQTRDQMYVLITMDRQVWLGRNDSHTQLVMGHAPNGNNIEVSFTWRLFFQQRDLLCRLADPNWNPDDMPYAPPTAHDIDQVLAGLPIAPSRIDRKRKNR